MPFSAETEYFIYVIRCALKGEAIEPPSEEIDWGSFIALSKKQEAYSIIASALPKEYMPEDKAAELNNYSKSELVRIIAMNSELQTLEDELCENKIKFMLLKGSRIKTLYPKESMRQMSDVDILYDKSRRDLLLEIMKDNGYTLFSWSENSDDFSKKPFYTFEFHRELFFKEDGFNPDFSFVWENAKQDGENRYKYIMSDEDLYIHSVAHMYKHYTLGGFGFRFIADNYLMLKQLEVSDNAYVKSRLEHMGIAEFEEFVNELTLSVFDGKEYTEKQTEFLSSMLKFSVYGDQSVGKKQLFEKIIEENNSDSTVKYALKRMFPDRGYMKRTYAPLEKKPYLLPFYYIKRLVVKSVTDGKRAKDEIKTFESLKNKNK